MNASVNQDELERFKELFLKAAAEEAEAVARMLSESADGDLLGKTEFALRDAVHRLGAKVLEGAANERAKKRVSRQQHRLFVRLLGPLCELAPEAGRQFVGRIAAGVSLLPLSPLQRERSVVGRNLAVGVAAAFRRGRGVGRSGRVSQRF